MGIVRVASEACVELQFAFEVQSPGITDKPLKQHHDLIKVKLLRENGQR